MKKFLLLAALMMIAVPVLSQDIGVYFDPEGSQLVLRPVHTRRRSARAGLRLVSVFQFGQSVLPVSGMGGCQTNSAC